MSAHDAQLADVERHAVIAPRRRHQADAGDGLAGLLVLDEAKVVRRKPRVAAGQHERGGRRRGVERLPVQLGNALDIL